MDEFLALDVSVNDMKTRKEYVHENTKKLLENVRNFFQKELKIVVPEYISNSLVSEETNTSGIVELFYINKVNEPIYLSCNGADDRDTVLDLFEDRLYSLLDSLDGLLDNNSNLDDESKESLVSYSNAVDKCIKVYKIQRKKRISKFKEMDTVDELRAELKQLFIEILSNYIISVLFDGLYQRLNNGAGQIYQMVVKEVNEFLSENGIYTKAVSVGDQIDFEYMEATDDSTDNVTDDYQKVDVIEEIRRYPYMFSDDSKVIDGCVKIWRRRD